MKYILTVLAIACMPLTSFAMGRTDNSFIQYQLTNFGKCNLNWPEGFNFISLNEGATFEIGLTCDSGTSAIITYRAEGQPGARCRDITAIGIKKIN